MTVSRINRLRSTSGFTMVEALLSLVILAFLFGGIATVSIVYREAVKASGVETFGGRNFAISPDQSTRSAANLLGAEILSVSTRARIAIAVDRPLTQASALALQQIPSLRFVSTADMTNPAAMRSFIQSIGGSFVGNGYSFLLFGANLRVVGLLNVSYADQAAPNGDRFTLYEVDLYGDSDSGFSVLYSYKFATNAGSAQPVRLPEYSSSTWKVTLPDPLVEDDHTTDDFTKRLTYEIVSPF